MGVTERSVAMIPVKAILVGDFISRLLLDKIMKQGYLVCRMRNLGILLLVTVFGLSGCKEDLEPIEVTEKRRLAMFDNQHVLKAKMPKEWRRIPETEFRHMNYRFGKDGEVYLSLVSGTILDNMNRWVRQFGGKPLNSSYGLEKVDVLGKRGVLIEVDGDFEGMGEPMKEGMALLGFLVISEGRLVTVKMVAKKEMVKGERERFVQYLKDLEWRGNTNE